MASHAPTYPLPAVIRRAHHGPGERADLHLALGAVLEHGILGELAQALLHARLDLAEILGSLAPMARTDFAPIALLATRAVGEGTRRRNSQRRPKYW